MMRWDYGSIYKEIRKSKRLSQDDVCGSTISRTTLSKLENNKLSPSFNTMSFLLEQINMTDEEFRFVSNNHEYSERERIVKDFFSLASNTDVDVLVKLRTDCICFLETNDDIFINEILSIIDSLLLLSSDGNEHVECLPKIMVNRVWQRISKMDTWYYNELRLINCILYYFPIDTVVHLLPKLMSTVHAYESYKPMSSLKTSLLLNVSTLLMQNKKMEDAVPLLEEAKRFGIMQKRYDLLSVSKIRIGICGGNSKEVVEGLAIIKHCGDYSLLEHMEEEIIIFQK